MKFSPMSAKKVPMIKNKLAEHDHEHTEEHCTYADNHAVPLLQQHKR